MRKAGTAAEVRCERGGNEPIRTKENEALREMAQGSGSAHRWGPLFGARARDWAETWEGPSGWGTLVYRYILDRGNIGTSTRLLDCGCGAGRFARMAADRGAVVAGIDAAKELIEIATERTANGDFRVGDLEALPWRDKSFDWVTGFSAFQFADNKVRALTEARRVSRGFVAIVIPSRASESGIASVFKALSRFFPAQALESMRHSGIFALSEPKTLDDVLAAVGLRVQHDHEIDCPILFKDAEAALRAFVGAGPTAVAIQHSGEPAVAQALAESVRLFTGTGDRVILPSRYRVVLTEV